MQQKRPTCTNSGFWHQNFCSKFDMSAYMQCTSAVEHEQTIRVKNLHFFIRHACLMKSGRKHNFSNFFVLWVFNKHVSLQICRENQKTTSITLKHIQMQIRKTLSLHKFACEMNGSPADAGVCHV